MERLPEQMKQYFRMEKQLLEAELRLEQLEKQLPEAERAGREADAALLEYESGGLRKLMDTLTGRRQEKQEALSRAAREQTAALERLRWEKGELSRQADALRQELEAMGPPEERFSQPELAEGLRRHRAWLLAKRLSARLEEADRLLDTARRTAAEKGPAAREAGGDILYARAEKAAQECGRLLQDIVACGIPVEVHPYFEAPTAYLHSVTENSRRDRVHHALDALWEAKHRTRELICQLAEE